jgi:hypothetical protein
MKVFVKGQGDVTLTQRNYVATGGQASVYVKDGTAYKIYTNPKDSIPEAKFQALATIRDPAVIKPEHLLLDESRRQIGYTMAAIACNLSLCQLFTRAFRDRNGITGDHIIGLCARLREHVGSVHAASILIVDLNELNILVDKRFQETYLIDVDSYQCKGYPATVIMPSVRDYSVHAADFSILSDWYSYGILAFQMFVGSHPYKGTHAASASIPKDQRMVHRMRHNISAFQADVSLPQCCYGFDVIPAAFRDWLRAVLQEGKRLPPPDPRDSGAVVIAAKVSKTLVSSDDIVIALLGDLEGRTLVSYAETGGVPLLWLTTTTDARAVTGQSAMQLGRTLHSGRPIPGTTLVGHTPKLCRPVVLNLQGERLSFLDLEARKQQILPFRAQEIAKSGDRFYIKNGSAILELEFIETQVEISVMATFPVADVPERASQLHDGCCVANMLGSIFVSLFPRSKAGYQIRMAELDGYKICEARFEGGVLMVTGARNGQYDRLIFRFDEDYQTYDVRVVPDVDLAALNFVTLDTGICVCVTEEEKLEAFPARKGGKGIKLIEDPIIGGNMRLLRVGGKVGFEREGKLYSMTLK